MERHGLLTRIAQEVDPDEELAAVTHMAAQKAGADALLFESFARNPYGVRVLSNMLGSSKERYALAVGLDPRSSTPELIQATRGIVKRRVQPVWVSPQEAPTRKPVIEVTAVRFRKNPIMTASLMAMYPAGEIGAYQAIMRSAKILDDLDNIGCSGIKGVYCHPAAASANCLAVVSLKQMYPGHATQALALTAQCPAASYYTKWIVAVDEDVDPTDIDQVIWAMSTRCNPAEDLDFLRQTMSFRADPSIAPQDKPYGSKVLINACTPYRYASQAPQRTLLRRSVYDRVAARWTELGLAGAPPKMSEFYRE
ncbi:UbiD family decarboxylase [Microbacteriaceae bacterium K1510]|nr:UbiD family decarboxylase [Microbacteriaceae bacterium K1510]